MAKRKVYKRLTHPLPVRVATGFRPFGWGSGGGVDRLGNRAGAYPEENVQRRQTIVLHGAWAYYTNKERNQLHVVSAIAHLRSIPDFCGGFLLHSASVSYSTDRDSGWGSSGIRGATDFARGFVGLTPEQAENLTSVGYYTKNPQLMPFIHEFFDGGEFRTYTHKEAETLAAYSLLSALAGYCCRNRKSMLIGADRVQDASMTRFLRLATEATDENKKTLVFYDQSFTIHWSPIELAPDKRPKRYKGVTTEFVPVPQVPDFRYTSAAHVYVDYGEEVLNPNSGRMVRSITVRFDYHCEPEDLIYEDDQYIFCDEDQENGACDCPECRAERAEFRKKAEAPDKVTAVLIDRYKSIGMDPSVHGKLESPVYSCVFPTHLIYNG